MFGFHSRHRSLISVKDMDKLEVVDPHETADGDVGLILEDGDLRTPREWRTLTMVYLLFLAEAIMASSLAAQVVVLSHTAKECMTVDASFLRGTLECAYFLGSTFGVFWGWTVDRVGRRKLALAGMGGMGLCSMATGFATTFAASASLRFTSGVVSSSVTIAALAMLADLTHGTDDRTDVVSRIPVIAACGSIGPLAARMVQRFGSDSSPGAFIQFPGLSGQMVCAGMVVVIGLAECLLLEEVCVREESAGNAFADNFLCRHCQHDRSRPSIQKSSRIAKRQLSWANLIPTGQTTHSASASSKL